MKTNFKRLAACIAAPLAVGGLAAVLTKDNMVMFELINKPPLSPPGWLFPVAWTILYILMGLASYWAFSANASEKAKRAGLLYYALSLALNFAWPILFFNYDKYLIAFITLLFMWLFILLATVQFGKADKRAALAMLPYLLWTSFAGYLNLGVYLLN